MIIKSYTVYIMYTKVYTYKIRLSFLEFIYFPYICEK